jgi:hypothetical protein
MEVDGPPIEQAADGAPAAPPAEVAADLPQLISAAATGPGQFIACMKVMYRRVPPESVLNRRVCVCCIWLCGCRSGARWRWSSTSRLKESTALRSLPLAAARAANTASRRWPQVQTSLSIHGCSRSTRRVCRDVLRCCCCRSRRGAGVFPPSRVNSAPPSPHSAP